MVKGFKSFQEWFKGYEDEYVIIGGTACDLLMMDTGLDFRATKDIDMVLILEALTLEFAKRLWEYIKQAGYQNCNKGSGKSQFYRFSNPKSKEFPFMIELFSKRISSLNLPDDAILQPIHIEDDVSSLSSILLDDDYYNLLKNGKVILDGVSILSAEYIIPFKMKAWLDLSIRKINNEKIDSKSIKKHKNDVFRLTELLYPNIKVQVKESIYNDINEFINAMRNENIAFKELGIIRQDKEEILEELLDIYTI